MPLPSCGSVLRCRKIFKIGEAILSCSCSCTPLREGSGMADLMNELNNPISDADLDAIFAVGHESSSLIIQYNYLYSR